MKTIFITLFLLFCDVINGEQIRIVADWYSPAPYTLEEQAQNYSFEQFMSRHPNVKIEPFSQLRVEGAAAKIRQADECCRGNSARHLEDVFS